MLNYILNVLTGRINIVGRDIFAGEKLIGTEDFVPKKQEYSSHPKWMMPAGTPEDRRRWMNKHHNGETHPMDL